jgi:hypothetical protein
MKHPKLTVAFSLAGRVCVLKAAARAVVADERRAAQSGAVNA